MAHWLIGPLTKHLWYILSKSVDTTDINYFFRILFFSLLFIMHCGGREYYYEEKKKIIRKANLVSVWLKITAGGHFCGV